MITDANTIMDAMTKWFQEENEQVKVIEFKDCGYDHEQETYIIKGLVELNDGWNEDTLTYNFTLTHEMNENNKHEAWVNFKEINGNSGNCSGGFNVNDYLS